MYIKMAAVPFARQTGKNQLQCAICLASFETKKKYTIHRSTCIGASDQLNSRVKSMEQAYIQMNSGLNIINRKVDEYMSKRGDIGLEDNRFEIINERLCELEERLCELGVQMHNYHSRLEYDDYPKESNVGSTPSEKEDDKEEKMEITNEIDPPPVSSVPSVPSDAAMWSSHDYNRDIGPIVVLKKKSPEEESLEESYLAQEAEMATRKTFSDLVISDSGTIYRAKDGNLMRIGK